MTARAPPRPVLDIAGFDPTADANAFSQKQRIPGDMMVNRTETKEYRLGDDLGERKVPAGRVGHLHIDE